MPSQKLVRCEIRPAGAHGPATTRFVPLEIFGLWEYLMRTRHAFDVLAPRASLWLDMEDSPEAAYDTDQYERITEVTAFVYSRRDDMFTRACRYFPSEECDRLKEIFLSHYHDSEGRVGPHVRERPGIWLRREREPAATP
jgi:hypothetical protein